MNYHEYDDQRQFNLPGYLLGQFFGYPGTQNQYGWQQPGGQFPGQYGQFPGQPGQFPGSGQFPGQPGQFPGGTPQSGGAPTSPPPSFTPQKQQFQTFAVDPGGIRGCLFRFTYIWLENGGSFWYFPTFVGRNSIAGFRWRRNRWVYFGIDLNNIDSFQCY
ncbi:hypothetical protein [Ornithinibacillus halophilus]|uniref:Transporter n=1 Tax=Ornithinibacillus halophilus TaxID=930117 RepID=A0A1M5KX46_9BACI|nr:hypothetical protein [Ornithinibacillus halophilus]SHG57432.1 hypothetical protein SAMN05216225_104215 [Ornithinibacillus halophilus]